MATANRRIRIMYGGGAFGGYDAGGFGGGGQFGGDQFGGDQFGGGGGFVAGVRAPAPLNGTRTRAPG